MRGQCEQTSGHSAVQEMAGDQRKLEKATRPRQSFTHFACHVEHTKDE